MNQDALEQYLAGPGLLRRAVAGMTRDELLARPIPGTWSTQEVVCHLADYEPIYADRMKRVIALEGPELLRGDPAQRKPAARPVAVHKFHSSRPDRLCHLWHFGVAITAGEGHAAQPQDHPG